MSDPTTDNSYDYLSNDGSSGSGTVDNSTTDPTNYGNEGNSGSGLTGISPGNVGGVVGTTITPTTDPSLLSTMTKWITANPSLVKDILSGIGTAQTNQNNIAMQQLKNQGALDQLTLQNDQHLALMKQYSDAVSGLTPASTGIIGQAMINNLRGGK